MDIACASGTFICFILCVTGEGLCERRLKFTTADVVLFFPAYMCWQSFLPAFVAQALHAAVRSTALPARLAFFSRVGSSLVFGDVNHTGVTTTTSAGVCCRVCCACRGKGWADKTMGIS